MGTPRVVLTYEDYASLPNDGQRYEIHDGDLSVTPSPGRIHQEIIGNLYLILRRHADTAALGRVFLSPFDVILSATTIVQPDLLYVEAARASAVSDRGVEGAPSLVIEVISPSTPRIDRQTKLQLYARYGVPCYWIVDPEMLTVDAYELAGDAYRLVTRASGATPVALPPFPALRFAPESLWP